MLSLLLDEADQSLETLAAVAMASIAKLAGLTFVAYRHRARFQKIGTVTNLYMYPVKSCGVLEISEGNVTGVGLQKDGLIDRQWAILDPKNKFISMKDAPQLSLIKCKALPGMVCLSAPDMPNLELPTQPDTSGGKLHPVTYYGQDIPAVECGKEAEKWITRYLGRPARFVFSCPELGTRDAYTRIRKWDNQAKSGDVAIFAYLTSYLVTTTSSLKHLNSQLENPVSMLNFRPNLVIDNTEPFDEDNWKELLIGDEILFHTVEPCRRCVITTIDPKQAKKSADIQPLKLLRSFRCKAPYGGAPLFGVYCANDLPGKVRVGDPVYVLKG